MARIRTIKPEAFSSESLAEVSMTAERTFFGLLTLADDHGRYRDQAAVICGQLWALRPEHTPLGVEDDLTQLAGSRRATATPSRTTRRSPHGSNTSPPPLAVVPSGPQGWPRVARC